MWIGYTHPENVKTCNMGNLDRHLDSGTTEMILNIAFDETLKRLSTNPFTTTLECPCIQSSFIETITVHTLSPQGLTRNRIDMYHLCVVDEMAFILIQHCFTMPSYYTVYTTLFESSNFQYSQFPMAYGVYYFFYSGQSR